MNFSMCWWMKERGKWKRMAQCFFVQSISRASAVYVVPLVVELGHLAAENTVRRIAEVYLHN